MIKSRYILTFLLLSICIFSLFQVKFKVQHLHREVAELQKQLEHEKDSIHVLKAEWAYLNKPERLQRLSSKFLELAEVKAEQIMITKPGSIIIAQAPEPSSFIQVENNNQLIKTSMTGNSHKKTATKWRYKDRPDLMRHKK